MKTKNQSDEQLFDPSMTQAANEDAITLGAQGEAKAQAQKQDWSPYEVWRTRVKTLSRALSSDSAPL